MPWLESVPAHVPHSHEELFAIVLATIAIVTAAALFAALATRRQRTSAVGPVGGPGPRRQALSIEDHKELLRTAHREYAIMKAALSDTALKKTLSAQ
jgi:hypothetical protein